MGTAYTHAVASLDGYIADERDGVGRSTTGISPEGWHPEASYHFATSVEEGVARAQEVAGEGGISVGADEVVANRVQVFDLCLGGWLEYSRGLKKRGGPPWPG